MDRKREAFIAAERARKAETGGDLSDVAEDFNGSADTIRKERSLAIAYLCWFLLGNLSAHRFYLGAYQTAVVQFLVGAFSWMLIFTSVMSGDGGFGLVGLAILASWALWVIGDVFFIHRIHRKMCRQPSENVFA